MRTVFLGVAILAGAFSIAAFAAAPRVGGAATPAPAVDPQTVDPNAARLVEDPVRQLQSRVIYLNREIRGLESRVGTLEEALRDMRARTEYSCDGETSVNGAGISENCSPFACNYIDGRCRTTAAKSDHCGRDYRWDGGSGCTTATPFAEEED
jgi:hypothetical protein